MTSFGEVAGAAATAAPKEHANTRTAIATLAML
jgi:hypothetical protein